MCRYCRIVAADLLALLAMDAEQAGDILALGALPLLAALLNLRHSPGVRCPPPCPMPAARRLRNSRLRDSCQLGPGRDHFTAIRRLQTVWFQSAWQCCTDHRGSHAIC